MKTGALLREIARRFTRAKLHFGHGTHNAREEAAWLISSSVELLVQRTRICVDLAPPGLGATVYVTSPELPANVALAVIQPT